MLVPKLKLILVLILAQGLNHNLLATSDSFFPSPNKIKCHSPIVRVVHYEEEPINFRQGVCGEKCLKKTMDIFQSCKGDGVKVLNMREGSDNGIDYFIVDEVEHLIVFLEAKGADFKSLFKAKGDMDLHDVILGRGRATWQHAETMARIKVKAEGLLKTGKQPADQLSRSWCEERVNRLESSSETEKLKKAIYDDNYKFMRLLSLTIASNNDISNKRAITYYMIVGDGDSDRRLTSNPKHRISITDGGVTNIVEEKERTLENSKKYCESMCNLLEGEIAIRFLAPTTIRANSAETVMLPQAQPAIAPTLQPSFLLADSSTLLLPDVARSGDLSAPQPLLPVALPDIQGANYAPETQVEEDYSYLNGLTDADVELALRQASSGRLQPLAGVNAVISSLFMGSTPPAQHGAPVLGREVAAPSTQHPVSQEDEVVVIDAESQLPNGRKRSREGE